MYRDLFSLLSYVSNLHHPHMSKIWNKTGITIISLQSLYFLQNPVLMYQLSQEIICIDLVNYRKNKEFALYK